MLSTRSSSSRYLPEYKNHTVRAKLILPDDVNFIEASLSIEYEGGHFIYETQRRWKAKEYRFTEEYSKIKKIEKEWLDPSMYFKSMTFNNGKTVSLSYDYPEEATNLVTLIQGEPV